MEKEIYKALAAAATEYFPTLKANPGNYSAAEVEKNVVKASEVLKDIATRLANSDKSNEERRARIIEERENHISETGGKVTVTVDSFSCTLPKCMLFAKLAEWEREFKIKPADRVKFVKEEEFNAGFSCIVEFPKAIKNIKDYVSKDMTRPIMTGVNFDFNNSCLVASDTHVLTVVPIIISDIQGTPANFIFADPTAVASCAGLTCKVELSEDHANLRIIKPNEEFVTMETIKGNYPAYQRVFPKVYKDGYYRLTKDSAKALTAFCKSITRKYKGDQLITFSVRAGATTGKVTYANEDYNETRTAEITLTHAPAVDVFFGINALNLLQFAKGWNGGMWLIEPSRPVVIDVDNCHTIVMPMRTYNTVSDNWQRPQGIALDAFSRFDAFKGEDEEEIINQVIMSELEKTATAIYLEKERQAEKEADEAAATIDPAPLLNLIKTISDTLAFLYVAIVSNILTLLSAPLQTLSTVLMMFEKWNEIGELAETLPAEITPKETISQVEKPSETTPAGTVTITPVATPQAAPVVMIITPKGRRRTPAPTAPCALPRLYETAAAPPGLIVTSRPPPLYVSPHILFLTS